MQNNQILFITQKRDDAIGIVDVEIRKELNTTKHSFHFYELDEKGTQKIDIIKNYAINIFNLLERSIGYQKLYFSWENPYVIVVKLFFPWKKIYMCVHHVESYWGASLVGKLIIKSTTQFIAISEFTKQQLLSIGVNDWDVFVNYNGISKEFYPDNITGFKNFSYILYVGSELKRKNLKNLLQAIKLLSGRFPQIKLIKIGLSGDLEQEQKTDRCLKELGLEENVVLIREKYGHELLRKYYSNAICYISVSKLEGFGLTIPEALACGCPVVASQIPPFLEILGGSQVQTNPDNIEEIANGIIKYIEDRDLRNRMSNEGKEIAKKFNWKTNVENLIKRLSKEMK